MATAAHKVSLVLETVTAQRDGVSVGEVAAVLGVSREAAARLLRSLVDEELLEHNARTDLYFPGIRLIGFGSAAALRIGPVDALYDPMLRVSREYRVPVMFAVTRGPDTYVLFRSQPSQFGAVIVPLGHSRPTHATASGRVSLAFASRDMLRAVEQAEMRKYTERTIATAEELEVEIEKARRQGYLITEGEMNPVQHVIAVPVLDDQRRALATLAISMIHQEEFERSKTALISELQQLAQTASRVFAYGRGLVHAV